jgi:hypothetical protein
MSSMVQKKVTIRQEHAAFLAAHKDLGFTDQSSLVRNALDDFIKETRRRQRRSMILQKANELVDLYVEDSELTEFTAIDGDELYEAGGNMGDKP